jgi:hypothetical protein
MPGARDEMMLKRFKDKIRILGNGCHQWVGAIDRDGYGKFQLDGKCVFAHRYAYQCYHGSLDDNLVIDHICRHRDCVNAEHMEQVTIKENTNRGNNYEASKTYCDNGHEFTSNNTYICPCGWRNCRACRRESDRKRKSNKCLN